MNTAVISGATRGIGKAIAFRLAEEGFGIAVCSSSRQNVDAFTREFTKRFPKNDLIASVCDVASKQELKKWVSLIKRKWNHVDVLVNNAGIFEGGGVLDSRDNMFEKVMAVNVQSAFYLTRYVANMLEESSKPHIFNMCSVASIKPYPHGALYGISKFALLGFSKSLREEMKPRRIAVTAMIPGAIFTDSWAESGIPEERFMQPTEIADLLYHIYSMPSRAVVEEVLIRPMMGDV